MIFIKFTKGSTYKNAVKHKKIYMTYNICQIINPHKWPIS